MIARLVTPVALAASLLTAAPLSAQISFPKHGYYAALGDSVAAGTGALPATRGYVYQLYDKGVFGSIQDVAFANASVRAARSWDLRDHQVPQLLCTGPAQPPTVVTITAGANDFFAGDNDVIAIAARVAQSVNFLLNNPSLGAPIRDPVTNLPCPALKNVTILVSNYYSIPHPIPAIADALDQLLTGFDVALQSSLGLIPVPKGSRVAFVDLLTPSRGRQGLVEIERRNGIGSDPFDFDPHPTNLGHTFIAQQFAQVWRSLQP